MEDGDDSYLFGSMSNSIGSSGGPLTVADIEKANAEMRRRLREPFDLEFEWRRYLRWRDAAGLAPIPYPLIIDDA